MLLMLNTINLEDSFQQTHLIAKIVMRQERFANCTNLMKLIMDLAVAVHLILK